MDDKELDDVLRAIACERYVPSEMLVSRTKATIRGGRLFRALVFLSLCTQLLTLGVIAFLLTSPDVPTTARIFGFVGLCAYAGCVVVVVVGTRDHVIWFFRRAERLIT
ncbi:MAG: hypothetical protein JSW58_16580 [Candidatus Latescibacterota bacterium]|nr:MAG: hypothetical protein JSW58_16580 [Candidatus Latescibacterota bacterium]